MRSKPARGRRGLTLIELVISMGISAVLVAAAVAMTSDHGRLLGRTADSVDMHQNSRRALDMIGFDLRNAGVGLAYRPSGWFDGVDRGSFTTDGGARFSSDGSTTDDLGIRLANGDLRTIAAFDSTTGQMCAGGKFEVNDFVAFVSREGLYATTAKLKSLSPATCTEGTCAGGCISFTWEPAASYASDPSARTASYAEGQIAGGFEHVVYYVHEGELKRASITPDQPCASRGCGGSVLYGADSLQVSVWGWDRTTSSWSDITTAGAVMVRDRLRVDVELNVHGQLENEKTPTAWSSRTSIEIRNSGRLEMR